MRRARPPSLMLAPFARSHRHAIAGLRKSRPACLSLHPRANHAAPCSIVAVPSHPATTFNGFGAQVTAEKQTRRCAAHGRGFLASPFLTSLKMVCGDRGEITRAGSFRPVAAAGLPRRETVRTRGEIGRDARHLAAKLRALRLPAWSPDKRLRAGATVPGELCRDRFNLALRAAGMKDANPADTQEPLSSKPPQCRIPLRVNPRH